MVCDVMLTRARSAGGVMSLLLTLTAPADRIEATIVFSTYLPMLDQAEQVSRPAAFPSPEMASD